MGRVDVAAVAAGYGAESARAATPDELSSIAEEAMASDLPIVIEVPVSPDAYEPIL